MCVTLCVICVCACSVHTCVRAGVIHGSHLCDMCVDVVCMCVRAGACVTRVTHARASTVCVCGCSTCVTCVMYVH